MKTKTNTATKTKISSSSSSLRSGQSPDVADLLNEYVSLYKQVESAKQRMKQLTKPIVKELAKMICLCGLVTQEYPYPIQDKIVTFQMRKGSTKGNPSVEELEEIIEEQALIAKRKNKARLAELKELVNPLNAEINYLSQTAEGRKCQEELVRLIETLPTQPVIVLKNHKPTEETDVTA
jgi:hypothetical protein